MRINKPNKKYFLGFLAAAVVGFFGLYGVQVFAQVSLAFPTSFAGFSSQDLIATISNITQIVLGFVGIIFIIMLIWAGILWATSGGNQDKINRAKKMITAAVIGLLITLSAFSIARFIVGSIQQAVTGPGTLPPGIIPPPPPIPGCPLPATAGDVKICNVTNPANLNQAITITGYNFGAIPGNVTINGGNAPIVSCSGSPSWGDNQVTVMVDGTTIPIGISPQNVILTANSGDVCDTAINECGTTDVRNGFSPFILCMAPTSGPSDGTVDVILDGGNFGTVTGDIEMEGAAARFYVGPSNIISWSDTQAEFTVPDVGTPQQAITGPVILSDSSFVQSNSQQFTVTCTLASDTSGECATGCCTSSLQCQPAAYCATAPPGSLNTDPVITAIVPADGAPGNYATVFGFNFGNVDGPDLTPGTCDDPILRLTDVSFGTWDNPLAAACGPGSWSDTQIVMEVPAGTPLGLGSVVVMTDEDSDCVLRTSNSEVFDVNNIVRPGICSVVPPNDYFGGLGFQITGVNLGGVDRDVFFGTPPNQIIALSPVWTPPSLVDANVPNIFPGGTTVAVMTDQDGYGSGVPEEFSNPLAFTIDSLGNDPIITDVSPDNGPAGTYVHITGFNFGSAAPGKSVEFCEELNVAACYLADVNFPPECSTSYWTDTHIIVKVPDDIIMVLGSYFARVTTAPLVTSQASYIGGINDFLKDNTSLLPGLCKVDPRSGEANVTLVDYYGEGFDPSSVVREIIFESNQTSPSILSWNNTKVTDALVPPAAIDGKTFVRTDGGDSVGLDFAIGTCTLDAQCPGSTICCVDEGLCRTTVSDCASTVLTDEVAWKFTSDQYLFDLLRSPTCSESIQSPTPFPYDHYYDVPPGIPAIAYDPNKAETNAPVNSVIAAEFNDVLDFNTILGPNGVKIYECNSGAFWTGGCTSDITLQGVFEKLGSQGFRWTPNADFNPGTWYEVRLDDGTSIASNITSLNGSFYQGSKFLDKPGSGTNDVFRWHFRTRTGAQGLQCVVANVAISPANIMAPMGGSSLLVTGSPVDSACYICSGSYPFEWECQSNPPPPNEYAHFSDPSIPGNDDTTPGGDGAFCTWDDDDDNASPYFDKDIQFFGINVSPNAQTPPTGLALDVRASILDENNNLVITQPGSEGKLTVDYIKPRVDKYLPNNSCSLVCQNSIISADFNVRVPVPLLPIVGTDVDLYRWAGPGCTGARVGETYSLTQSPNNHLEITPSSLPLNSNTCYQVVLHETISNDQGQQMDSRYLNYFWDGTATLPGNCSSPGCNAFSWTFTTSGANSVAECSDPDGVTLNPWPNAYLYAIGDKMNFYAGAYVTDPVCGNMPIDPYSFTWVWTSSDPLVAILTGPANTPVEEVQAIWSDLNGKVSMIRTQITGPPPYTSSGVNTFLVVYDLRDPFDFIGYRPDSETTTYSPPLSLVPGPDCLLGGPPSSCVLPCTNLQASAIFSAHVDPSSVDINKFYAHDLSRGVNIPGSISVRNYSVAPGSIDQPYCSNSATTPCSNDNDCVGLGYCINKRGLVEFIPNLGALDISAGLLAYYTFDDNSTSDESGNWVRGNLIGGAQISQPADALRGRALQLDGQGFCTITNTQSCRINSDCPGGEFCGSRSSMDLADPLGGTTNGTLSLWLNPITRDTWTTYVYNNAAWGALHFGAAGVTFDWFNTTEPNSFFPFTPARVPQDDWTHIVLTYEWDGTTLTLKIYENGTLKWTDNSQNFSFDTSPSTIQFGNSQANMHPYNGYIDEIAFYDRALDPIEVFALYVSGQNDGLFNAYIPAGVFPALSDIEMRLCYSGSCVNNEIKSTQGLDYDANEIWSFQTGAGMCSISFVDINPNPAVFIDVISQCVFPGNVCTSNIPMPIIAQAKDATGLDLSNGLIDYIWRTTPPYISSFYELTQAVAAPGQPLSDALHKELIGTDYNSVQAQGFGVNLGVASATGRMDFFFCENPWIGSTAPPLAYYLDASYDFRLEYCRDDQGQLLPNLPTPHIIRQTTGPFAASSDLLREHVFIVGGSAGSGVPINIPAGDPSFDPVNPVEPVLSSTYEIGDLVIFKLNASDPEGDVFTYTLTDEVGLDALPATANFNSRTGTFLWVIDKNATDDDDTDGTNDFEIVFGLSSGPDTETVYINVLSGSAVAPGVKPNVTMDSVITPTGIISSPFTTAINVDYGSLVRFKATGPAGAQSFVWDFQDAGTTSYTDTTAPTYTAKHTFVQSGVHQVTFRAKDSGVWSDPAVVNINVYPK